jgi:hypothetical protein
MTLYPSKYWLEPRGEYDDLYKGLSKAGLIVPFIPEHLRPKLRSYDGAPVWSTSNEVDPYDIYQLFFYHEPEKPIKYLQPNGEDFLMMGRAGRTAAFTGIIARFGPLFVAQTTSWFGAQTGLVPSRVDSANRCNEAWNTTVASLFPFAHEQLRVAVVYSEPRGYAQIWKRVPDGTVAKNPAPDFLWFHHLPDSNEELLTWDIIEPRIPMSQEDRFGPNYDVKKGQDFGEQLQRLVDGSDEIVAIAAKHLLAVTGS